MAKAKMLGALLIIISATSSILYTLWFLGLMPGADPELAIRIPVLLITLTILFIIGFIGYVTLTTKPPKPIRRADNIINKPLTLIDGPGWPSS